MHFGLCGQCHDGEAAVGGGGFLASSRSMAADTGAFVLAVRSRSSAARGWRGACRLVALSLAALVRRRRRRAGGAVSELRARRRVPAGVGHGVSADGVATAGPAVVAAGRGAGVRSHSALSCLNAQISIAAGLS